MKITFLGTNGWYDTKTGNTASILIETEEEYIVLDAGFGFYKVKDYVRSKNPFLLFLSHLHLDHIIGLHTLPLFKLPQGINVYAPKGMLKDLRAFLRRPFTASPIMLPTKIRFIELTEKTSLPFTLKYLALRHLVPCYGYRFNIDEKIISYCTDTGLCGNIKRLAADADILITECAMAPDEKGPNIFHLTPRTAAGIAKKCAAKRLALTHFDPGKYPTLEYRKRAEDMARSIFKEVVAANDGTVIEV